MRSLVPLTSAFWTLYLAFLSERLILKSSVPHQVQLCAQSVSKSVTGRRKPGEGGWSRDGRAGGLWPGSWAVRWRRGLVWRLSALQTGGPGPPPGRSRATTRPVQPMNWRLFSVCMEVFWDLSLPTSEQELRAIKIEMFSKLCSSPLEIMITNKLTLSRELSLPKCKLWVTKNGLKFKVTF